MYGIKHAPRGWYSRLDKYLWQQGFRKWNVDNNIYIKVDLGNMIVVELYVDGLIFGCDDKILSQNVA